MMKKSKAWGTTGLETQNSNKRILRVGFGLVDVAVLGHEFFTVKDTSTAFEPLFALC